MEIHKNDLFDPDNMDLTVDSLIVINNIITNSNNIALRKVNVKPYGYDKTYMDKDLIEDKLYKSIDQFNKRNINHRDFYIALINNIYQFYDENVRILFVTSFN